MAQRAVSTFELEFPYNRTLGPVVSKFLTGLRDGEIWGNRAGTKVFCPPVEAEPDTGESPGDFVELTDTGVVTTWAWVSEPMRKHPLDKPFAWALIRMDGADSAMLHAVDAGSKDVMSTGMQVRVRWRAERRGHITDIECFEPA